MPGWHDATKEAREAGRVRFLGIVQEQHPDRARLFMQWKGMDWPVLVDSLDLLGVAVVPITLFVDEHGIVRKIGGRPGDLDEFLGSTFEPPETAVAAPVAPDLAALERRARDGGVEAWRDLARALVLWGEPPRMSDAVAAYERVVSAAPESGADRFGLGVAHRRRHDSSGRERGDFQSAVGRWEEALALDPNQYIWRRRIQQYGPRLDKPYPFYDWVDEARAEVAGRGETPVELRVEPRGAEIATPERKATPPASASEPDPEARVIRDRGRLVIIESTLVRHSSEPGRSARVHLELAPNPAGKAHWNNESAGLTVWLDPPAGWSTVPRRIELPNPPTELSDEPRAVEIEVRRSDAAGEASRLRGYALYYVCEKVGSQCLYRRQDIDLDLTPTPR